MYSALPLTRRLPMMPSPPVTDGFTDRFGHFADRDDGAIVRRARSRAGRSRCSPRAAGPSRGAAMRSMTVDRSSDDERSRPTSRSAAVSRVRRCISSNSRAFSSATPMLAATVCEQSHVGVAEGVLALMSSSTMTPTTRSPATDRERHSDRLIALPYRARPRSHLGRYSLRSTTRLARRSDLGVARRATPAAPAASAARLPSANA